MTCGAWYLCCENWGFGRGAGAAFATGALLNWKFDEGLFAC